MNLFLKYFISKYFLTKEARERAASEKKRREEKEQREREQALKDAQQLEETQRIQNEAAEKVCFFPHKSFN